MQKHWLYLRYLIRHKWFVWQAGRLLGVNWFQLLIHDWSKFLPSEWFPYVNYFYGYYPRWEDISPGLKGAGYPYELTKNYWEVRFEHAWNLHQKRNRHHYQFWILTNDDGTVDALEMPRKYELEMVADWAGAGRAITGKWELKSWYQNSARKNLHFATEQNVDQDVETLDAMLSIE